MANLIIKSSANDLVIQGSDESPAITVGATGTTTFAENATLSGTANALGTVTAGTLSHGTTLQGYVDSSNTGVTFPTGHVLQTVVATQPASIVVTVTANSWNNISGLSAVITPSSTSSRILATVSLGRIDGSSSSLSIQVYNATGGTAVGVGNAEGSRMRVSANSGPTSDGNHNRGLHATVIDSPSSMAALTYNVQWADQSTILYLNRSRLYGIGAQVYSAVSSSSLILQEIA